MDRILQNRVMKLFLLSGLILLLSCTQKEKDQSRIGKKTSVQLKIYDTLTVTGSAVIFFEPTEEELENSGISFDDLYSTRRKSLIIGEALRQKNMLVFYTAAHYIAADAEKGKVTIERLNAELPMGIIVARPGRPLQVSGKEDHDDYVNFVVTALEN